MVVLLAVAVFAGRVLLARAHDRPAPVASSSSSVSASADGVVTRASPAYAGGGSGSAKASPTASATVPGSGTTVVVDVVGQVRHPGVYTLRSGQRVDDAVRAAGGVVAPSDVAAVNLACVVVDGEQIRVPRPGEPIATGPLTGGSTTGGSGGGLVNLNTAGLADLDGLPGVGPVLAQRILDWRTMHGRFTSVDELGEVSGIGEKLLGQLRSKATV